MLRFLAGKCTDDAAVKILCEFFDFFGFVFDVAAVQDQTAERCVAAPLEIFDGNGNDYNTPDGSAIRDYIYVVDLAKAHVKAMQRLLSGNNKNELEIFNLGTGKGVSVLELVNAFVEATGVNLPYKIVGRRDGDTEQVWADNSLAEKELGWSAKTPLNDVLASAWNWLRKKCCFQNLCFVGRACV